MVLVDVIFNVKHQMLMYVARNYRYVHIDYEMRITSMQRNSFRLSTEVERFNSIIKSNLH